MGSPRLEKGCHSGDSFFVFFGIIWVHEHFFWVITLSSILGIPLRDILGDTLRDILRDNTSGGGALHPIGLGALQ